MKVCPRCNANYEDSMFFCLEDGTPLQSFGNSVQPNPSGFEQTLAFPTDEKTLNLPTQHESGAEKTLTLPAETVTEQKSIGTAAWQPAPKTDDKTLFTGYFESDERDSKSKFIVAGATLGGVALLGTALGGWWLMQKSPDEMAVANVNKQTQKSNNNPGLSNTNLSVAFGENNSNSSNFNSNTIINTNKPTPKPSATKDTKESPTPTVGTTPQTTSTPTPVAKSPTPLRNDSTPPPVPKTVSGGVVNGKAVNLVRPPYPPAARAVRASGAVNVQVTIDEDGNVISASAVSGHPLLRAAAESAARASKFSPTVLAGQKVKVTGVIVYNFTAQ